MKNLSLFSNCCPHCQKAKIFSGLLRMNKDCPNCKHHFEKESGYFIGSMLASYFLGVFLLAPTLTISLFAYHLEMNEVLMIGTGQLLILQPILFRFSRLFWIQLEHRLTKAIHQK